MKRESASNSAKQQTTMRNKNRPVMTLQTLEPRLMLSTVPNDPLYPGQWHLNNTGQLDESLEQFGFPAQYGTPGDDISAEKAWDITTGSNDVVIGVLDTGMDITHPDLVNNVFTNTNEIPDNGIDDDGNGFIDDVHGWNFTDNNNDVTDYVGHGTHVAGIIGASGNNGTGLTGVNWNVKLLPLKIGIGATEGVSFEAAVAGIEYAVALKHQGVNIVAINGSFGGYSPTYDPIFDQALHDANDAGILFVVAAGNENANNDPNQNFPAKYSLNNPNVITVAATDNQDQLAFFSNFGQSSVNIAAPGVGVFSTWSRMVDDNGDGVPDQLAYNTISGTSMASPVVAGVLGLEAAANPTASMMQLKDALLNGVKPLPSLQDMLYDSPNKVSTGGRVDAFHAVLNIRNQLVGTDAYSAGNWTDVYGTQGALVVGAADTTPNYVNILLKDVDGQVVPAGGSPAVRGELLSASTTDVHALVNPNNPGDRVLGQLASDQTMNFDMNFTDGQIHRVTFYATDLQNLGRTQEFIVRDADSGMILAYQGLWDFQAGRYVSFDLSGHVLVQIHNTKPGADAIVNGIFFDPAPQDPSRFVKSDTTTGGDWRNQYGSQGAYIVGQADEFPSVVGVLLEGNATGRVLSSKRIATDPRALDNANVTDPRHMLGYFATPDSMTFDLHFKDADTHQVGLYLVDYERLGRAERIDILDASDNVVDSQLVSDFGQGKYLFWNLDGNMKIRITRLAGPDAVVSGFFFDTPPGSPAQFLSADRTTSGNWRGRYGFQSAVVLDEPEDYLPPFADVDVLPGNRSLQTVVPVTSDPRAPQLVHSLTNRTVSYLHTTTSMTLDINITDNQTHRFSIYALDWDRKDRAERIEMIDPTTGQVLTTNDIADFENGVYLSWNIRGHVQMRITRLAGPTAPISAYFFD